MLVSPAVLATLLRSLTDFNVLHVGAHQGEESEFYQKLGAAKVYWVEAQAVLCEELASTLDPSRNAVSQGVAWSRSGERMVFHVTNNSQSSSLYRLKDHVSWYPDVVEVDSYEATTIRLDELVPRVPYALVCLDIQGAELNALKGMGDLLDDCLVIYSEVNRSETYEGIDQVEALDAWLTKRGFSRLVTKWSPGTGWGDAVYTRGISPATRGRARLSAVSAHLRSALDTTSLRRTLSRTIPH